MAGHFLNVRFSFMKRKFLSFFGYAALAVAATCFVGCSDDEPDDPGKDDPGKEEPAPDTPVSDPEGTALLSMRNSNNGGTYLGDMYIDKADNFAGVAITSLGKVAGLGNIVAIPKTGYADKSAVVPNYGYVAYNNGAWYRIFVVGYVTSIYDEVLGADIKYQQPFYGRDEALQSDVSSVTFDAEGGDAMVQFTNSTLIPFTLDCADPLPGVYYDYASTLDSYFLRDAVFIHAEPSTIAEAKTQTIVATTGYGKEYRILVTQAGTEPFLNVDVADNMQMDVNRDSRNVGFSSNIDLSNITITSSDESWLTVEATDNSRSAAAKMSALRWVGEEKAKPAARSASDGVRYYNLCVTAQTNLNSEERTATVTLRAGAMTKSFTVTQFGATLVASQDVVELKASASDEQWVGFTSNLRNEWGEVEYEVEMPDWCHFNRFGDTGSWVAFSVDANESSDAREGYITLSLKGGNLSATTKLIQKAASLWIGDTDQPFELYFDRTSNTKVYDISSELPYTISSDAEWLSFYENSGKISIITTAATENRKGRITFEGTNMYIDVHQSKYAVGDNVADDNGVEGIIYTLDEGGRVYKELPPAAWSTQFIPTGATSRTDGEANTATIHSVPNWRENYPAFANVDALNTGSVTGWYMPACDEFTLRLGSYWTSTEVDANNANYRHYDYQYTGAKSSNFYVIAVRKVDLFKVD